MYKEKKKKKNKTNKEKNAACLFSSLSAYLYADLETGWLATGISGCPS